MIQRPKHSVKISSVGITTPLAVYALWRHIKVLKNPQKPDGYVLNPVFFLLIISLDQRPSTYISLKSSLSFHASQSIQPVINHPLH